MHHFVKYEFSIFLTSVCMHLYIYIYIYIMWINNFIKPYLFEVVKSVCFPFQNGPPNFEMGRGPFQHIQIIYCFENIFVHIPLYTGNRGQYVTLNVANKWLKFWPNA